MQSTFHADPFGITDLSETAKRKGIVEAQGLKPIAQHLGLNIRKDPKVARSSWSGSELSSEQIQFAADDAYFAISVLSKLDEMPDHKEDKGDGYDNVNQGVLTIKPEWEGIIIRKSDGLWCCLCDQGPMNVPEVV